MKTTWEYSPKSEALRVIHSAHQIVSGFYRINNFFVLPYSNKIALTSIVKFPDLPFNTIPRFWEKAKQANVKTFPIRSDKKTIISVINLLKNQNYPKPDYSNVQSIWDKAENEFFNEVSKLMPDKKNSLKEIVIQPTIFGTTCSFSYRLNKDRKMYIYLRDEQDIYAIAESILTYLTRTDVYEDLNGNWSESELLVDWLITKSSLADILKKYAPDSPFVSTLKGIRVKQNAKLLQDSEEFYKKLGLPVNKSVFSIEGTEPMIYKIRLNNLTPTEKTILKLLIEKANNIASFDDLGNLLFKSEDDFSLYAISKQIERLRNKLEENGISGSYIQTLRGQGYILKN